MAKRKAKTKFELEKDPRIFGNKARSRASAPKLALGLDLGTNCGYCYAWFDPYKPFNPTDIQFYAGVLDLSAGRYDSGATRFCKLRQFMHVADPDAIAYEDVKFVGDSGMMKRGMNLTAIMARMATSMELLGAFRGVVAEYAEWANIPCEPVPIGVIKKRATGRGNANKAQMIVAANEFFGTKLDPESNAGDDNVADALWILLTFLEEYSHGVAAWGDSGRKDGDA